jgi:O-methyltransferase
MVSPRRRIAKFLIETCRARSLHGSAFQRAIRAFLDEIDLQHLRDSCPCPRFGQREQMFRHLQATCFESQPIDYLEFGVYRGESIRLWAELNTNPRSRFYGFDSFEGLPEDWRVGQEKGHFDMTGEIPVVNDTRVTFVKGWFDVTVPAFVRSYSPQGTLVIHLDADLYGSTMVPLIQLAPFINPGTMLIFDEFYDRDHEFKAFVDFQRIERRDFRILACVGDYAKVAARLR